MGNDSGIGSKTKQRTALHHKHAAFPGMYTPKNVEIKSGVIKPARPAITGSTQSPPRGPTNNDPQWVGHDALLKSVGNYGSAVPLPIRRRAEIDYVQSHKNLVKENKINDLKRKYKA